MKQKVPKLISRNEYYRMIRNTGQVPADDEYQIIPLDLSHYFVNDDTKRVANKNFTEETTDKNGNYLLRGYWLSDLSIAFAERCKFNLIAVNAYSSYAYSDEQLAVFKYTEGDICLTLFTDLEKYSNEKENIIQFCTEVEKN